MIYHGVVVAPESVGTVYDATSVTLPSDGLKTNRVAKNDFYQAVKALALADVTHLKLEKMKRFQKLAGHRL